MEPGAPGAIRTPVPKGTFGAVKELSGGAADKGTLAAHLSLALTVTVTPTLYPNPIPLPH